MDETLKKILDEVSKQPFRSSIITSVALIETMLEKVLRKYLVSGSNLKDIFGFQGPLGSLSAKTNMAYALGLVSKELYDDLHLLRKIRNDCAHEFVLDEKNMADIKSRVGKLNLIKHTQVVDKNADIQKSTALEFALILFCLIKRLNNTKRISRCEFEIHDNYLTFSEEENQYITDFANKMKEA